jgi:hypothetical protein
MEFTRTPSAPTHRSIQHDELLLFHQELDISSAKESDPINIVFIISSDRQNLEIAAGKYCRIVIFRCSQRGPLP